MSETAHTPLPWHAGHFADDNHSCNCAGIVSECYAGAIAEIIVGNGLPISDGGNDAPPPAEAKANLTFIVRAVNSHDALVAALEECADDLEAAIEAQYSGIKDHPAMTPKYERDMETVTRGRAAISLAKGQS